MRSKKWDDCSRCGPGRSGCSRERLFEGGLLFEANVVWDGTVGFSLEQSIIEWEESGVWIWKTWFTGPVCH